MFKHTISELKEALVCLQAGQVTLAYPFQPHPAEGIPRQARGRLRALHRLRRMRQCLSAAVDRDWSTQTVTGNLVYAGALHLLRQAAGMCAATQAIKCRHSSRRRRPAIG